MKLTDNGSRMTYGVQKDHFFAGGGGEGWELGLFSRARNVSSPSPFGRL